VNDAFVQWVGRDRSDIIGHAWPEFAQWENPAEQAAFFKKLERTHSVRNVECRLHLHDGRQRIVLVSVNVIEISREPHMLCHCITEQKNAEAELQNALAKEREVHQLKSDFVSLVPHEFRTSLKIIMSSADNLDRYHDRFPAPYDRGQPSSISAWPETELA
jgi:PAS domain S-box-containing protein